MYIHNMYMYICVHASRLVAEADVEQQARQHLFHVCGLRISRAVVIV